MNGQERRDFVRSHRTASSGMPATTARVTVVYYVMDGDDLLVSTMAERAKAKTVARVCRVKEARQRRSMGGPNVGGIGGHVGAPMSLVYGTAKIVTDSEAVVELGMRVMGLMAEQPMPESHRPHVAERMEREKRIMLRITPYMTFETPPRHVEKPDDVIGLTHWLGTSLPWDAVP